MAEIRNDQGEITARIVYWGIAGAGISANLAMIHSKLKGNNRGALRTVPTRIDPTVEYELLPIELGRVNGVPTRLNVIGVPGSAEQSPTRKQLLDRADGIVFVADSRPDCMQANVASLRELVEFLDDYGCTPSDLPFVIQYNKCDLVDPFVIERLHREIQVKGAAVYEASARTGTGILKTLTTISKQVIRHLGKRDSTKSVSGTPARTLPIVDAVPVTDAVSVADAVPVTDAVSAPDAVPVTDAAPIAEATPAAGAIPVADAVPIAEALPTANDREREEALAPLPAFEVSGADRIEPEPASDPVPFDSSSSQSLMENAILAEAAATDEANAADVVASDVQIQLDQPWDAVSRAVKPEAGARIGADLRIVSVGEAHRTNDRAISVPLVLGNDEGETVTLALTIQLDPLLDGDS